MNRLLVALVPIFVGALFGHQPAVAVTIATVPVGDVGNANAGIGYGAVATDYRIGEYEVTNAQYAEFLNAKAASDPLSLYSTMMGSNPRGGITRSGASGSFNYAAKSNMGDKPVNFVSWYDAIRFANWLNNGQGSGNTETGAYSLGSLNLDGTPVNDVSIPRNSGATWFLPSAAEWIKAACYDPTLNDGAGGYWLYPTQSNAPPTIATADSMGNISNPGANVANYNHGADWNGLDGNLTTVGSAGPLSTSHYGTFDQVGNVWEWTQTGDDFAQILSGGEWNSSDAWQLGDVGIGGRAGDSLSVGFRVATVPEPSTFALGILGLMACARRRRLSLRS